jgi:ABC-type sulfate transport system permease component
VSSRGRQVVVRGRLTGRIGYGLLLLAAGIFALLIVLPIFAILLRVFVGPDLLTVVNKPVVWEALRLSLLTSVLTLAIALVLGTPVAWLLARRDFPGKSWLDGLIELPMVLPPAVAGLGLLMAFGAWAARADPDGDGHHHRVHHGGCGAGPGVRSRAVLRASGKGRVPGCGP